MSRPSIVPKPYVFWKWRNGGESSYAVERSPLILPVVKPVVREEDKNSMCSDISFSRLNNKREDSCAKIGEREMVR